MLQKKTRDEVKHFKFTIDFNKIFISFLYVEVEVKSYNNVLPL